MSPNSKNRVHFAEQPAVVVGTGAGPSDDDEDEDSDQYYERMDSPSPPLVTTEVSTVLSSYKKKVIDDELITVGGHTFTKYSLMGKTLLMACESFCASAFL